MENKSFEMDKSRLDYQAEKYFIQSCGLQPGNEKLKRMMDDAEKIRKEMYESIRIQSVLSFFDQFELQGEILRLEQTEFKCNAFSLLDPRQVKAVYAYVVTAGDCSLEGRGMMDQLYADMWGTAYLDAGRNSLKEKIMQEYRGRESEKDERDKLSISASFGPGFYGMDVEELFKIFQLTEPEKIGVVFRENCAMDPIKSCAGLYLIVKNPGCLPDDACESCIGRRTSCSLCNVGRSEGT